MRTVYFDATSALDNFWKRHVARTSIQCRLILLRLRRFDWIGAACALKGVSLATKSTGTLLPIVGSTRPDSFMRSSSRSDLRAQRLNKWDIIKLKNQPIPWPRIIALKYSYLYGRNLTTGDEISIKCYCQQAKTNIKRPYARLKDSDNESTQSHLRMYSQTLKMQTWHLHRETSSLGDTLSGRDRPTCPW